MQIIEKIDELLECNKKKENENIYIDKITGLLNIFAFQTLIGDLALIMIKDVIINNTKSSIIVCDLNYLKNINDEFGHLAGNKALKDVSNIILTCLEKEEKLDKYNFGKHKGKLVFRVGGDEFLILLPGKDKYEAEIVKNDINNKIEQYKNSKFFLSLAMGIVSTEDMEIKKNIKICKNVKKLLYSVLEKADSRMYEDKKNLKLKLSKEKKDIISRNYISKLYDFLGLNINTASDYDKLIIEIKNIVDKK